MNIEFWLVMKKIPPVDGTVIAGLALMFPRSSEVKVAKVVEDSSITDWSYGDAVAPTVR